MGNPAEILPLPYRAEVERHVEQALAALPEAWRQRLVNLAIIIEDYPDEDPDDEEGDMLGMLDGPSITERPFSDPYSYPTRLVLFSGPMADEADDRFGGDLGRVVRETVWHELAHYFGHDEDGAYALETKWEANWRQQTSIPS